MKWLVALCLLCIVGLVLRGRDLLGGGSADRIAVPPVQPPAKAVGEPRRQALLDARHTCAPAELDKFIAEQQALVQKEPANATQARILAEALLERVQLRNMRRGMEPGAPLYDEVPAVVEADLQSGLELVNKARALGEQCADLFRIEASLLSNKITGIGSAMQWNGRIQKALGEAAKLDESLPSLHVALGLRKLLAPPLLGQDTEAALKHFEFAAEQLPADERPRVFAGMAAFLLKKREQAIAWLQRAVTANPNNVFACAVLKRLVAGEADPFARDVPVDQPR
jgi:tetratricopeptide (TPR) repeat protein